MRASGAASRCCGQSTDILDRASADITAPTLPAPNRRGLHQGVHLQLAALACLADDFWAAHAGLLKRSAKAELVAELIATPGMHGGSLKLEPALEQMSHKLARARDILYLGRAPLYPLALEGALKLKELSYIHAEGYAAGELKHGPIALIDEAMPVIILGP